MEKKDFFQMNIDVWKKIIDVQMHFNDMQMRVRNYAVLLLSAIIGVAGVSMKDNMTSHLPFFGDVPLASVILFLGAGIWVLFFFMDYFWYHKLLYGAVKKGVAMEKFLKQNFSHIDLTGEIGRSSPVKIAFFELHSNMKMMIFYGFGFLILLCLAFATYFT